MPEDDKKKEASVQKNSLSRFDRTPTCDRQTQTVPSLPASGPWAPPAERGPSLESIYRVSLTVDLCGG